MSYYPKNVVWVLFLEYYCRILTAIKLHNKNKTNKNYTNSKMKCRKHGLWVMELHNEEDHTRSDF